MSKTTYDLTSISGKNVYIFENHATALLAWADYRRNLNTPPLLLTLDHHTDTCEAFRDKLSLELGNRDVEPEDFFKLIDELARAIDFNSRDTVMRAVTMLDHDEQIDAAIRARIVRNAFVICYDDITGDESIEEGDYTASRDPMRCLLNPGLVPLPKPSRPFTYEVPFNGCFTIGSKHGMIRSQHLSDSANRRRHYDRALERDYLEAKLSVADEMAASIGVGHILEEDFILDIDLDYFHSVASIRPSNPILFYDLIRASGSITVAREPEFVGDGDLQLDECDIETRPFDSDFLLGELMAHLRKALNDN